MREKKRHINIVSILVILAFTFQQSSFALAPAAGLRTLTNDAVKAVTGQLGHGKKDPASTDTPKGSPAYVYDTLLDYKTARTLRQIAKKVGRAPSTIEKDLRVLVALGLADKVAKEGKPDRYILRPEAGIFSHDISAELAKLGHRSTVKDAKRKIGKKINTLLNAGRAVGLAMQEEGVSSEDIKRITEAVVAANILAEEYFTTKSTVRGEYAKNYINDELGDDACVEITHVNTDIRDDGILLEFRPKNVARIGEDGVQKRDPPKVYTSTYVKGVEDDAVKGAKADEIRFEKTSAFTEDDKLRVVVKNVTDEKTTFFFDLAQ